MEGLLTWLQELPLSVSISESESLWGWPLLLVLHSFGIGLTAGTTTVMSLRMLGVVRGMPVSSLRPLLPLFWTGLGINAVTGSLIFMTAATSTGYHPLFYAKLACILLALVALRPIRGAIRSGGDGTGEIPAVVKTAAAVSLLLWVCVITTGRLIPYTR